MSAAPDSAGTLQTALAHASRVLETDPSLAAEHAADILRRDPRQPLALLVLGVAHRRCGETAAALQVLADRIVALADAEDLPAHGEAVRARF